MIVISNIPVFITSLDDKLMANEQTMHTHCFLQTPLRVKSACTRFMHHLSSSPNLAYESSDNDLACANSFKEL